MNITLIIFTFILGVVSMYAFKTRAQKALLEVKYKELEADRDEIRRCWAVESADRQDLEKKVEHLNELLNIAQRHSEGVEIITATNYMITSSRLAYFELSSYMHQYSCPRQAVPLNDHVVHAFLVSAFSALDLIEKVRSDINYETYFKQKPYYIAYFASLLLLSKPGEVLRITNHPVYDRLNKIADQILGNTKSGILGEPTYKLVSPTVVEEN